MRVMPKETFSMVYGSMSTREKREYDYRIFDNRRRVRFTIKKLGESHLGIVRLCVDYLHFYTTTSCSGVNISLSSKFVCLVSLFMC